MYINITNHCLEQTIRREKIPDREKADDFLKKTFRKMYEAKQKNKEYNGRQVRNIYKNNNIYLLTDGVIKIIYTRALGECILITFIKKTENDKLEEQFCNKKFKYKMRYKNNTNF